MNLLEFLRGWLKRRAELGPNLYEAGSDGAPLGSQKSDPVGFQGVSHWPTREGCR
jgi:hypothetical protein